MNEIQKIKQEIERLKEHTAKCGYPGQGEFENGNREGRNWVCDKLLSFIDSLSEESKCIYNRTLDERKKFCKYCSAACDVRIEEEPASEDSVPNVTDRHKPTKESVREICQILNEPRSYRSSDSKKQPFIQDLD